MLNPELNSKDVLRKYLTTGFLLLPALIIWVPRLFTPAEQRQGNWVEVITLTVFFTAIAGLLITLIFTRKAPASFKLACALGILPVILISWINGAVGIIGAEENPANLLFVGVFAAGLLPAVRSGFSPDGLSRAMLAAAAAQLTAAVIVALLAGFSHSIKMAAGMLAVNGCFAAIWAAAYVLLQRTSLHTDSSAPA